VALEACSVGDSNFSPMDGAFEDWFEGTLRSSARGGPKISAVTAEPASVLAYNDDLRSHRGARSAEQIEPTDALLAGKV